MAEDADDRLLGLGRIAMYALAIWPDQPVPRDQLRRLMPDHGMKNLGAVQHWHKLSRDGTAGRQSVSTKMLQNVLAGLDREGMVVRTETSIIVLDRHELLERSLAGVADPGHRRLVRVQDMITAMTGKRPVL